MKRKKPASQRREPHPGIVFPLTDQSTVLACWAMPCGTGNLLGLLWRDGDGPLQGRIRYENEGRKQVFSIPIHSTLEATILKTREVVAGFRAEMERVAFGPFHVHERARDDGLALGDGCIRIRRRPGEELTEEEYRRRTWEEGS